MKQELGWKPGRGKSKKKGGKKPRAHRGSTRCARWKGREGKKEKSSLLSKRRSGIKKGIEEEKGGPRLQKDRLNKI